MMRSTFMLLIIVGLCLLAYNPSAQAQNDWPQIKRQVKQLCLAGNYRYALDLLESRPLDLRRDEEGAFLSGLCLYQLNQLEEAESRFQSLLQGDRTPISEVLFYLGKVYHASHQFNKAVDFYKSYLKSVAQNHPHRDLIMEDIKRCANGLRLQFGQSRAFIENLGELINTPDDEFGPIPSPNYENKLYFSSSRRGNNGGSRNKYGQPDDLYGNFSSDIYYCLNKSGKWQFPTALHYQINTNLNEVIISVSPNGQKMYYYQGYNKSGGRIMVDTFQQSDSRIMSTIPFLGPVEATADHTIPHFYNENVVVFSSNTMGGYGGMDLFISMRKNGQWSIPKNLGPQVNSPYDEVTPFLANGGRELYFSTNNPEKSIGGLDILKSFYDTERNRWLPGINLGLPLNSAADDAYFKFGNDGYSAFFSSSRKDGYGKRDIYIAYFNDELISNEAPASYLADNRPNGRSDYASRPATQNTIAENYSNTPPRPVRGDRRGFEFPRGGVIDLPRMVFSNIDEVLTGEHQQQLNLITELLKRYPQLKVLVSVYSNMGSSTSDRLYSAILQAERVATYLKRGDVDASSIMLRGFEADLVDELKRQPFAIDFNILEKNGVPLRFQYNPLSKVQVQENELIFKILFERSNTSFEDKLFEKCDYQMIEKAPNNYLYFVGEFRSYETAYEYWKKLKKRKDTVGKITPFIDGRQVTVEEYPNFIKDYPELKRLK